MDRGYLFLEGNLTKFNNLRLLPSTTMPARPDRGLAIQTIMFSHNAFFIAYAGSTGSNSAIWNPTKPPTVEDGSVIVVDGWKIAVARKTELHTKLADHGDAVSEKVKSLLLHVVSQGGGLVSTWQSWNFSTVLRILYMCTPPWRHGYFGETQRVRYSGFGV